ncbi:protein of unknown function [Taphrina deformans PYCC 5710]|uniref:Calcineurin-like phosphoesterase domain-containing protein n=1 Tax=Taphrina deformans (strain PYCC 5710 / ATCC 11124 / CBS 356.35 / IMI 108563 / JCM 9778 / NBRC 8474) TaxID=1097556 RepID=R4XBD0_TAPDE|nr:protein of unknown function [Taphrina deformans PYCC 5710]|eukprot:CCG81666.1 protein of unknown function [Taphrina deformans PYCC 5710]
MRVDYVMRYRRRPLLVFLYLVAGLLLARFLFLRLEPWGHVQTSHLRWHSHGLLYSLGFASLLTKKPLLQVVSGQAIDVVFEIRHDLAQFLVSSPEEESPVTLYWAIDGKGPVTASAASILHDENDNAFVFRARIAHLLLAQSTFSYHIEIGTWRSEVYRSNLFAPSIKPNVLLFGVIGDNQFAAVKFSKILNRLRSTTGYLDAFIHLGDAVQDAVSARAWSTDFWDPLARNGMLDRPWIMLRGNHDAPSVYTSSPRGKDSSGYTSFLIEATNTFIMILDSNNDSGLQDRHIKSSLASDAAQSATRRIVLVHIPPFVEYWDPGPWRAGEKMWGAFVRDKWVPIFAAQNVDLVISGHQHNYQRGRKQGIMYVIAGGAGGTLDHDKVEDYSLDDGLTIIDHHFGVLELDIQGGIHWRLFLEDGTMADEFVI